MIVMNSCVALAVRRFLRRLLDAGLLSYYKFRTEPGSKQNALVPEALTQFSAYDLPEVQQDFVHSEDNVESVSLYRWHHLRGLCLVD